jgi:hypothetical protein
VTATRWSASRLATFHACLRKYQLRYLVGLIEPATGPQHYGSGSHRGLEAWLLAHHDGPDARLAAALAAVNLADPVDAAKARAVLTGYEARWGEVKWRVLAVEVAFSYELDGHIIDGYIDAIIQDETDGRVYVVEHKNTTADTSPGSSYWEVLTIDRQVSIYVDAATVLGYDIAGVIYDALARPKHERLMATPLEKRKYTKGKGCKECGGSAGGKRGVVQGDGRYHGPPPESYETTAAAETPLFCEECKGSGWSEAPRLHEGQRDTDETLEAFEARVMAAIAEKPDAYYQRGIVVRTEDELPKMRADILNTIKLARTCEALDFFPRGNTSACRAYGSTCFFLAICCGSATPDDPRFARRPQPEAAPVTQP